MWGKEWVDVKIINSPPQRTRGAEATGGLIPRIMNRRKIIFMGSHVDRVTIVQVS